ncbi:MAG: 2Fe-2S iron-sulfur cluster-binding protein [Verrucomicrobiia bacterium]|jgi:ferredoxin-NADP reductase
MATTLTMFGLATVAVVMIQALFLLWETLLRIRQGRIRNTLEAEILGARLAEARHRTERAATEAKPWEGKRKFRIDRKERECEGVYSFYLKPHDGMALPTFLPGQHIAIDVKGRKQTETLSRYYTLSDAPGRDYYRISVKSAGAPAGKPVPAGLVSNILHNEYDNSRLVDLEAPAGAFHLDPLSDAPIILIAGGIGITPMLSMGNFLRDVGSEREVWLFYGTQNSDQHVLRESLDSLASDGSLAQLRVFYSQPLESDFEMMSHPHYLKGRLTIDALKKELELHNKSNNFEFYLCGPGPMMESMVSGLKAWGVPADDIHLEEFGPSSGKAKEHAIESTVSFAASGTKVSWRQDAVSIWNLARESDVKINYQCRKGECGKCLVAIREGTVEYTRSPAFKAIPHNHCLTCITVPSSPNIELEA